MDRKKGANIMNELVILEKDDIFTNSLIIAKGTGNQHKSVIALIKKISNFLNDLAI